MTNTNTNTNTKYNLTIDEKLFNDVFFDYNEHGYHVCGFTICEFFYYYEKTDKQITDVINKLPDKITSNDLNMLIKSDNLKTFLKIHMLSLPGISETNFNKMIDIIKQNEPHKIDNKHNGIKSEYKNEFADKIYDELLKNAILTVNGQKIYVLDFDCIDELQIKFIETYYKNK